MKRNTLYSFYSLRRWLLKKCTPEWVWPKSVFIEGVEIKIRNTPYSFGVRRILVQDRYETAERKLLSSIICPGMQVLELGSSIGILTAIMSSKIGEAGRIVAVEASKKLTSYSKTWLEKPGHVDIVTGYAFPVFKLPKNIQVSNFIEGCSLGGTLQFSVMDAGSESIQSGEPIFDIYSLCQTYDINPELVVVDVEGSESIMLLDAPNFPSSVRYLLIELHPWMYSDPLGDRHNIILSIEADKFICLNRVENVWLFGRT